MSNGVNYSVVVDLRRGTVEVRFAIEELRRVDSRPIAQAVIAGAMWDAGNELLACWSKQREVTD